MSNTYDPTRATVHGEEPPPPPVPGANPVLRSVNRPAQVVAPPVPDEMVTHAPARQTLVAPEPDVVEGAPPPLPASIGKTVTPLIHFVLPEAPKDPDHEIVVIFREVHLPQRIQDIEWLPSQTPLGAPVIVRDNDGAAMISVIAAARVWSFSTDVVVKDGKPCRVTTVKVDIAFGPLDQNGRDRWQTKFYQDKDGREGDMKRFLEIMFAAEDLQPGLVIRAVGGPIMDCVLAQASGYHRWEEGRSPTRVERDARFVQKAREDAEEAYLEGERSLWRLKAWYWRWRNPDQYALYLTGKELESAPETPKRSRKLQDVTILNAAECASLVVMSLFSVRWSNDPAAVAALSAANRTAPRPTVVGLEGDWGDDRPVYFTHFVEES